MNCVPCLAWVPKGAARKQPEKVKLSEAEMAQLIQNMQESGLRDPDEEDEESSDEEEPKASSSAAVSKDSRKRKRTTGTVKAKESSDEEVEDDTDDIDKKYGLSDYDNEDDAEDDSGKMKMSGIATFATDMDDPFLSKDVVDSDEEDMMILPEDNLLAVGRVKKEYCGLEVYVYNEKEENCWCHHDIILPTFPLAMEWLDFDPGEETRGNFIAMGTMAPDIEIWDLDVVDTLEPAFILAGAEEKKSKKKKSKKAAAGHTDSVLDLSWNRLQRNVLASASADFTIGLWDLTEGKMVSSMEHHKEKVQTLQWHPCEPQSLVSGSFDHTAKIYDCRSPKETVKSWKLPGEVEKVLWNPHDPFYFFASSDTGHVYYLDVRGPAPVFTLQAHTKAVTGLTVSSSIPNCLVTSSADHEMKVWDIANHKPTIVYSKDMKVGQMYSAAANPNSGLIFAVGGETEFRIVNLKKNANVASHFGLDGAAKLIQEKQEKAPAEDDEWEDEGEQTEVVPIIGGTDMDQNEDAQEVVKEKRVAEKKKKKKNKKTPKN